VVVDNSSSPPQLFQPDIPVIAVGHFAGDRFVSDQILVKHTANYIAEYPSRVTAPNGTKRDGPPRLPLLARPPAVNGTLGHIGVLLGFAAAVVGCLVLVVGLVRGRPAG